jgi:nitrite reductase/ring-hydroxylating ferredoxin subunit
VSSPLSTTAAAAQESPWRRACSAADLPDDGLAVKVQYADDQPVAVFRVGERYYAVQDWCSHDRSSLSEDGYLEGTVVECAWHGAQFDLVTGRVCRLPARAPLLRYEITVDGDDVLLRPA